MTEEDAHKLLSSNSTLNAGKFYGSSEGLGLGAGLIYENIRCPIFDIADRVFLTLELPVYVLTHECDVDPSNRRAFSDHLTVCPLIPLQHFLREHSAWFHSDTELRCFLAAVAERRVNRLAYLPPGPSKLASGAFLYLNKLASTHVCEFNAVKPVASVSAFGLATIDQIFANHFLRPKSDRLSFSS